MSIPCSWGDLFDRLPKIRGQGLDIARTKDLLLTVLAFAGRTNGLDPETLLAGVRTYAACPRDEFISLFETALGTTDLYETEATIEYVCNAPCRDIVVTWTLYELDGTAADGTVIDDDGTAVLEKAYANDLPSVNFFTYGVQYVASFDRMRSLDLTTNTEMQLHRSSAFALDDNFVAQDEIVTILVEGRHFHIPLQCVQAHPDTLLARYVSKKGTRSVFRVSGIPQQTFQYVVDFFTSGIVELDQGLSKDVSEDVKILMRWGVPVEAITCEKGSLEDQLPVPQPPLEPTGRPLPPTRRSRPIPPHRKLMFQQLLAATQYRPKTRSRFVVEDATWEPFDTDMMDTRRLLVVQGKNVQRQHRETSPPKNVK